MQKNTLKKLSVLGLVLMAASAVAAILPDSKKEQLLYTLSYEGTATANGDSTQSCAPTINVGDDDAQCQDATASPGLGSGSGSTSLGIFEVSSAASTLV